MLVLTRKIGEGVVIGDDVKIVVMQIKGKQVRLGIKAGPNTVVHREEVFDRIQDENRLAGQLDKDALSDVEGIIKDDDQVGGVKLKRRIIKKKDND